MAQPKLPFTVDVHAANPHTEPLRRIAESAQRFQNRNDRPVIETPHDAAAEIVPVCRTILRGIVLLLLDVARRPMVGLVVHDAPRNEFERVVELLSSLTDSKPDAVILGVLSREATVHDEPYVFGSDRLDTTDRLAVDAATVHAWAEFSCQLEAIGIILLDVIECTPWSWASVHAPAAPYLPDVGRFGLRSRPPLGDRQPRASAAR